MTQHFQEEQTLIIIKPDGIQRSLVGEIIKRFERIGLKLCAIKLIVPTAEQVERHYLVNPLWKTIVGKKAIQSYKEKGIEPPSYDANKIGERVLDNLKVYITAGPVIAIVLEGAHAGEIVRKLVGKTEPLRSDVGTIRGDFMLDSYQMSDASNRAVRNLVHASGTPEEAIKEIEIWFNPEELVRYRIVQEEILYDSPWNWKK